MRKFQHPIVLSLICILLCCNYEVARSQLSLRNFAILGGDSTASTTDSTKSGIQFGPRVTIKGGGLVGTQTFLKFSSTDSIDANVYTNTARIDTSFVLKGGSLFIYNRLKVKYNVLQEAIKAKYLNPGSITVNGNVVISTSGSSVGGSVTHPNSYKYTGPVPALGEIKTDSTVPIVFPQMPSMPPATVFPDSGTTKITTKQTITPGGYGTMMLGNQKAVTFSGVGVYVFNQIKNGTSDTLKFDFQNNATGIMSIYVYGNVDLGSINVVMINGGSASRIYIENHGTSFVINGSSTCNSIWSGTIYAPNGTVTIGVTGYCTPKNTLNGSIWSPKKITLGCNTTLNFVQLSSTGYPVRNSLIRPYYTPPASGKTNTIIGSELTSLYENPGIITTDSIIYRIVGNNVYIEAISKQGQTAAALTFLVANGLTNIISNGPGSLIITGSFPIANLLILNTRPDLFDYVRPLFFPLGNSGVVTTRGDTAISSNIVRTGYNMMGEGVKVGVMSDSYNTIPGNYAGIDVSNDDLPGNGNPNGNTDTVQVVAEYPFGQSIDEGRAMLQIVHDIAPKAQLAFRTGFVSAGDFAVGIGQLGSAGCNVIVDDVTYMTEPFFTDGVVANAVDTVVAHGTAYFSAAGNFGTQSYQATFTDMTPPGSVSSLATSVHNFGGNNPFQTLNLTPGNYTIVLQWSDNIYSMGTSSTGTQTDLDIYLTDDLGATLFGFNRNNIGTDPIEVLPFTVTGNTTANLIIAKASGPDVKFKYIVFRGNLTISGYAGSSTLVGQANSAGAIAVGAVLYTNTPPYGLAIPTIASFSSAGGDTVNGVTRNKPELTAPNGVNTTVNFGSFNIDNDAFPNFFGTSCAAPHAAAAAALIIQGEHKFLGQTITPANLRTLLENTAIHMGSPTPYNPVSGYGFIQPLAAMETFASPRPEIDSLETPSPVVRPVTTSFTVTVKGKGITPLTQVYLRGAALATNYVDNQTVTAVILAFSDNPPVQLFTPSIIPLANQTTNIDGGFSDSLFFFPLTKNIVVTADSKTKKYGEKMPPFTATITVDGIPIDSTNLTRADLKLDSLTYTTPATISSNVANYFIRITNPLNPALPTDSTLLTKYIYTFVDGVLTVNKLPLKITPRDTTLNYGDKIHGFHYNYLVDSTANLQNPDSLRGSIQLGYASTIVDSILAVVSGKGSTSKALVNSDLNNLSILISNGSGATSRALVNSASGTTQTEYIVDVADSSLDNYSENPASSVLVNGKGATSRALINTSPLINGTASVLVNGSGATSRALVNGNPSLLNSTTADSTSNSNVAVIISLSDVPAAANNSITTSSVDMITGDITVGTHTIVPGAFVSGNYLITYGFGNLTINKAPLTITANTAFTNNAVLPSFTSVIKGFQYQDSAIPRTGPTYSLSPAFSGKSGVYTIIPSALSFAGDSNYTKKYVNGVLYVNPLNSCQKIVLSLKCVEKPTSAPAGLSYLAHFIAQNNNSTSYYVPNGSDNSVTGSGKFSGTPPTVFPKGTTTFDVYFDGKTITWTLKTYQGTVKTTQTTIASSTSTKCTSRSGSSSSSGGIVAGSVSVALPSKTEIYPNPASDKLIVTSSTPIAIEKGITVYDVNGRAMPVETISQSTQLVELDVSRLIKGVYFIRIVQGTKATTFTFVKL